MSLYNMQNYKLVLFVELVLFSCQQVRTDASNQKPRTPSIMIVLYCLHDHIFLPMHIDDLRCHIKG